MATETIPMPSRSHRRPRAAVVAAVALVAGACIGAGAVALTSSERAAPRPETVERAAAPATADARACAGDGGAVLATVASMPIDVANDIASRLSAPTRALLASAIEQSAITRTVPGAPDTATLATALSRLDEGDAAVVMSGLSPDIREAVAGTAGAPCR